MKSTFASLDGNPEATEPFQPLSADRGSQSRLFSASNRVSFLPVRVPSSCPVPRPPVPAVGQEKRGHQRAFVVIAR